MKRPRRPSIGLLLRSWRKTKHLSQLALATHARVSPRHLAFIETGRAKASREMILHLASALDVPLRERNALLLAAGFAPLYTESKLDEPSLAIVRRALDAILRQHEPFPAVVMNRTWDVVQANAAARRFFDFMRKGRVPGAANVLRTMFHPNGVRSFVTNWMEVGEALVQRVHREAVGGVIDTSMQSVLEEILGYPGVPEEWQVPDPGAALLPVVPVRFRKDDRRFDFFSTVTTLGAPQDITVQEIRLECFFPTDDATDRAARSFLA